MRKPHLEALEERDNPSVSFGLTGTSLSLTGSPDSPHNVLVRPSATANAIDVLADGQLQSFTGLTQVNYSGRGSQADTITNRTSIPGVISLGNGANVVLTAAAGSTVTAGNGANVIQATGGGNVITAGNGDNSVYGGPNDVISVGNGQNVVYALLGVNTITVGSDKDVDRIYTNAASTVVGATPQDRVATFFAANRLPGSGNLVLDSATRTLYFAADNQGDTFVADQAGPNVFVRVGRGSAPVQTYAFDANSFDTIAVFGGAGNDTFVDNTTKDSVLYGAGGSNVLIGSTGDFNLLKAGGAAATNSVAWARSPVANDVNGSGQPGTQTILIADPQAQNIFRSNSSSDVFVGLKATDMLVSLYPDQIVAALFPAFVKS